MGYKHINNLYKDGRILMFKECYVMEKVHGTSSRIEWKNNKITYFPGGCKFETFLNIFDKEKLENNFKEYFKDIDVTLYGEQYGGKQQGMSHTYGKDPKFIVFEVNIENTWLNVPNAEDVTIKLDLEFVPYYKTLSDISILNKFRDMDSDVAKRRGCGEGKLREGIVIRPLEEFLDNRGHRIIVKHKRTEFIETKTQREVNPEKLKILSEAKSIAEEWVTPMRFKHVIDKFEYDEIIENTKQFILAMQEDVIRESEGEVVMTDAALKEIAKSSAILFKNHIKNKDACFDLLNVD